MSIKIHNDIQQGSDEWHAARCGLLTASTMKNIITPATLKYARNDASCAFLHEIVAQRITRYAEPSYQSFDMARGHEEEADALAAYSEHYADIEAVGFVTNDKWGFTLGYSPDAFCGQDGLIEVKSRRQKYQIETVLEHMEKGTIPPKFALQIQTGLLVSEREWCDFVSYSGGLPMAVIRVYPDAAIQEAIIEAATCFEVSIAKNIIKYNRIIEKTKAIPTVRREYGEMVA